MIITGGSDGIGIERARVRALFSFPRCDYVSADHEDLMGVAVKGC